MAGMAGMAGISAGGRVLTATLADDSRAFSKLDLEAERPFYSILFNERLMKEDHIQTIQYLNSLIVKSQLKGTWKSEAGKMQPIKLFLLLVSVLFKLSRPPGIRFHPKKETPRRLRVPAPPTLWRLELHVDAW